MGDKINAKRGRGRRRRAGGAGPRRSRASTTPSWRPRPSRSACPSCSSRPRAAAARACAGSTTPATWRRHRGRPPGGRRPPSGTPPCWWSGSWPGPATSRSRCSPTPTGRCAAWASGSAACSAATRRSSRRRRRRCSTSTPGSPWRQRGGRRQGVRLRGRRDGRVHRVRRPARRVLLHGNEHPSPGRAPRDRSGPGRGPGRVAAAGRRRRAAALGRRPVPRRTGHAIEARVYAEDPGRGFLPASGTVLRLREPTGLAPRPGRLRPLRRGPSSAPSYDPMLAKVIAWGEDRARRAGPPAGRPGRHRSPRRDDQRRLPAPAARAPGRARPAGSTPNWSTASPPTCARPRRPGRGGDGCRRCWPALLASRPGAGRRPVGLWPTAGGSTGPARQTTTLGRQVVRTSEAVTGRSPTAPARAPARRRRPGGRDRRTDRPGTPGRSTGDTVWLGRRGDAWALTQLRETIDRTGPARVGDRAGSPARCRVPCWPCTSPPATTVNAGQPLVVGRGHEDGARGRRPPLAGTVRRGAGEAGRRGRPRSAPGGGGVVSSRESRAAASPGPGCRPGCEIYEVGAARRPAERVGRGAHRHQGRVHCPAGRRRAAHRRGHQLRVPQVGAAARRRRGPFPAARAAPTACGTRCWSPTWPGWSGPGRPAPATSRSSPAPPRASPGATSTGPSTSRWRCSPRSSPAPARTACGSGPTSRCASATPGRVTCRSAQVVAVADRLIVMGAQQLSIGDTIGVATPGHVHDLIDGAGGGRDPGRPTSRSTSTTPTARPWPTPWPPWKPASPPSTPRPAASAAARTPRAPPATWPPRTWCGSCTASVSRPGWTSTPWSPPASGWPPSSGGPVRRGWCKRLRRRGRRAMSTDA